MLFKSTTILLFAVAESASAADSFNVKLKYLGEGINFSFVTGTFLPAADDNLGSSCDRLSDVTCASFECEHFDRSIDVFSEYIEIQGGLRDVSIETAAPYAIHVDEYNDITLVVADGESAGYYSYSGFCTGYNGFQSSECAQLPNVPEAIERSFWSGGASPGTGNTGWGSCRKCSDTCYTTTETYGDNSCNLVCNDSFGADGDWDFPGFPSSGTKAKNAVVAGLLVLSLTSLVFVGI